VRPHRPRGPAQDPRGRALRCAGRHHLRADDRRRRRGADGCARRPGGSRGVRLDRTRARSRAADSLSRGHAAQPLLGRLRQEQDRGRGRADAALARAAAAGHDRASDARVRPAQHAEQRDVLLRPARPQPAHPRSGRGRLASPVRSRRRPGRRHGGDARRAGVVRPSVQRDRRGGRDAGRLRRADRRSPQAAGHLRPRRDGAWRQGSRLRPESGLRLPRGVHDDEDSRRARHPSPLLAGGRARANLRMVRARGARSSRRRSSAPRPRRARPPSPSRRPRSSTRGSFRRSSTRKPGGSSGSR
jgi:hypothetical protein